MKNRTVGLTVSYNQVCLQDCELLEWDHRIERDEHHNYMWDTYRITVASTIVSNATAASEVTLPTDQKDPDRFHQSQAFANAYGVQNGLLATDNWMRIERALGASGGDFAMWYNDASADADAGDGGANSTKPEHQNQRTSPRRFVLVASGFYSAGDSTQSSGSGSTFLNIFDPWQKIEGPSETAIKRSAVLDCWRGPKPGTVQIQPIGGSRLFRVVFSIEICRQISDLWEFSSNSGSASETMAQFNPSEDASTKLQAKTLAYNRWSFTDSEDESGAITHTISGRLIVKDLRYKPNAMRLLAFPLAFPFAKMMGRRYAVSEDGLTLSYEFSYKHAGAAPPLGVRNYQAAYQEELAVVPKAAMSASMSVKVFGWYHRSDALTGVIVSEQLQKIVLLRQAMTIVYSRIRGLSNKFANVPLPGQDAKTVLLTNMKVIEQIGVPELELRVDVVYTPEQIGNIDTFLRLQNLGAEFIGSAEAIQAYQPFWWPIDNEWGRLLDLDLQNPTWNIPAFDRAASTNPEDPTANIPVETIQSHNYAEPWAWTESKLAATKTPQVTQLPTLGREDREISNVDGSGGLYQNSSAKTPTTQDGAYGTYSSAFPTQKITPNPIAQPVGFTAIRSKLLDGEEIPAVMPPTMTYSRSLYDPMQQTGQFSYLSYSTSVESDSDTGVIALPLSKPRKMFPGTGYSVPEGGAMETQTFIRMFAGGGKRVVNVTAERIGNWPTVPEPAEVILRSDLQPGGTSVVTSRDVLVTKKIAHEDPEVIKGGQAMIYRTHLKLVYASSRPWSPNATQAGYAANDIFPVAFNKITANDATFKAGALPRATSQFEPGLLR